MSNKFEVLTGRDQILKRPQMWVGAMDPIRQDMFVIGEEHIENKTVEFIPAFRKIIDEILDNSLDALVEHQDSEGEIRVKMDDEHISIEDNGPGIPVIKKKQQTFQIHIFQRLHGHVCSLAQTSKTVKTK